jgi:glycosyltransferase involved in cell wall biosynthesis
MGQAPVSGSSEALVSVVVPANNEVATVPALVEKTAKVFADLGRPWELVYVDDGSSDGTAAAVEAEAAREPRVRLVRQRRRLGLTEALNRGFREARGEIIVFLPADLESDPEVDVPLLLGRLDQGYDVVAGWRQGRRDGKRVASRIANVACRLLFGLEVHDLNWIKAFRREVTDGLHLRSQWHRYILVMAHNEGYRIGEVKVPYRPREAGRSKFGLGRLPVSAIDVVTLKFLLTFQRKPIIFFGGLGSDRRRPARLGVPGLAVPGHRDPAPPPHAGRRHRHRLRPADRPRRLPGRAGGQRVRAGRAPGTAAPARPRPRSLSASR